MELARVIGSVVATQKLDQLRGIKLLLIQPVDHTFEATTPPIVACDTVGAGVGEIVKWIGGREATLALPEPFVAVDATIVGIIDHVE